MTSILEPICYNCAHFVRQPNSRKAARPFRCMAFPNGIPAAIKFSEADHRQPFEGDHGIQFESDTPAGDAYAAMIFGDAHKVES